MTRVLLFLDSSGLGGIETHVATLAEALPEAGFPAEVMFWRHYPGNPFEERLRGANLPFSSVEGRIDHLFRRLRAERPVLLHTHGYKAGILGRLVARLARVPVVSTYHAGEKGPFPVNLYQSLDAWTGWLAEGLSVSVAIARQLPFRTQLAPNFIRFPLLSKAVSRHPQIGFVGRLSPEKAPDRFVTLALHLRGEASFHVFGDGPMRPALVEAAGSAITWHGMVNQPAAIWPALDLLVMPSRAEGLPMAALEALASGVPIVSTDVGAMAAVIGEGSAGWLVNMSSDAEIEHGLSGAVRAWLAMTTAEKALLRQRAHHHGAAHFGLEAGLDRILATYRRAGASPASHGLDHDQRPVIFRGM